MNVMFSSFEEFVDDLTAEHGDAQIDEQVVRITVEKNHPDRVTTEVRMTAGYSSLGELRQFRSVGVDHGSETSASQAAAGLEKRLRDVCEDLDLKVRGGKFEE